MTSKLRVPSSVNSRSKKKTKKTQKTPKPKKANRQRQAKKHTIVFKFELHNFMHWVKPEPVYQRGINFKPFPLVSK